MGDQIGVDPDVNASEGKTKEVPENSGQLGSTCGIFHPAYGIFSGEVALKLSSALLVIFGC